MRLMETHFGRQIRGKIQNFWSPGRDSGDFRGAPNADRRERLKRLLKGTFEPWSPRVEVEPHRPCPNRRGWHDSHFICRH